MQAIGFSSTSAATSCASCKRSTCNGLQQHLHPTAPCSLQCLKLYIILLLPPQPPYCYYYHNHHSSPILNSALSCPPPPPFKFSSFTRDARAWGGRGTEARAGWGGAKQGGVELEGDATGGNCCCQLGHEGMGRGGYCCSALSANVAFALASGDPLRVRRTRRGSRPAA